MPATAPSSLRDAAFAAIDAANAEDPNLVDFDGATVPRAQLQGRLATRWIEALAPGASDEVHLAARAHHLRRWSIDRATYPEGRGGYHRWKRDLRAVHASSVREVLASVGIESARIDRVADLVQRVGLGTDPDTQLVEDAACLVFLETQYEELIDKIGEDKVADAVRKTLPKMSAAAIALAPSAVRSDAGLALLGRVASAATTA